MAMKRYDVVAVTGTYNDADGTEKRRYMNCGVVLENERGLSLKLDAIPTSGDGWFYLFEPDPDRQRSAAPRQTGQQRQPTRSPGQQSRHASQQAQAPSGPSADYDDDLPF